MELPNLKRGRRPVDDSAVLKAIDRLCQGMTRAEAVKGLPLSKSTLDARLAIMRKAMEEKNA